jgi:cell division protein FtsW
MSAPSTPSTPAQQPTATGTGLRSVSPRTLLAHPRADYYLILGSTLMLLVLGLVMVLSASSVIAYSNSGNAYSYFARQATWAGVGLIVLFVAARSPIAWWRRTAYLLLFAVLLLLAAVLIPGIGTAVNGQRNWIDFGGPFRLQPSETAKLVLVVWGAAVLATKGRLIREPVHLAVPLLPVAVVILGLVLAGGDLGTALVIAAIVAGLWWVVGAPMRVFVAIGAVGLAGIAALSIAAPYRLERFSSWLNPEADYLGAGWQAVHGKFALASGGWWGLGLGASREKWGGLPEAHTDFIFAIVGEELGLVGTLTVLLLFTALLFAAVRVALRAGDDFVRIAAAGIAIWIAFQAVVNIGAVLGLLPITGVPLPLVSYGGTAMLTLMISFGLLLSAHVHRDVPMGRLGGPD